VPTLAPRTWPRAFRGFYRPTADGLAGLDPVARFLYAARSVILVISAQAAAIAGLLAAIDRRFSPLPFVLVLVAFVLLHAVSNLSNDFFGYRRGHDVADSPRLNYTLHPLASGAIDARTLGTGIAVLVAVCVAIGGYFLALRDATALWFALAGGALLWLYDAAPVTLKAVGLGELASFAVWGPIMVGGGYAMIAGDVSATAYWASVPYGLGVMSILVGKHIDQRRFDSAHRQNTLPVVLGEDRARWLDAGTVAGMYVVLLGLVVTGSLPVPALLALVALPRALRALSVLRRPRPAGPPAGYVGWPLWYHRACLVHNRLFGWAYLAGLAVAAVVPSWRL
jgi:1,4-dihydroxy-2-naphthoate octaprenyltransferase